MPRGPCPPCGPGSAMAMERPTPGRRKAPGFPCPVPRRRPLPRPWSFRRRICCNTSRIIGFSFRAMETGRLLPGRSLLSHCLRRPFMRGSGPRPPPPPEPSGTRTFWSPPRRRARTPGTPTPGSWPPGSPTPGRPRSPWSGPRHGVRSLGESAPREPLWDPQEQGGRAALTQKASGSCLAAPGPA